ncbi:UDP-N-acetylmuramoyl-L-alanyl-D-glutamate--2,6-diaminopimelate ligase [Halalkalibacter urbisdiaboli]|uniref:UDP-N-acetylmuramoyl-L-alanyl-D-glutamate--2, 6-diaminopimelate ligase n=1 Tax=Halalkalibacter urbisdiaboli TaxID=1960589 RepID=UPI000B44F722|nr:UDP-N-acetylmuramoyl-L-alanyl-D-glutamate--2,6-diaminopimelate ligase [Halalkalibacter urbisdiaboli]
MKLSELMTQVPFSSKQAYNDVTIHKLEMDSRLVEKGTLFFCIKGYTVDGHDFAEKAVEQGAVAIVAERPISVNVPVILVNDTKRMMAKLATYFYGNPTSKLHLIGVTGTNGKTSVTHIIEQIMKDVGQKTGLIGTMYTKVGENKYETKNTTPESIVLQQRFKQMVDENVNSVMMEVSSHALHLGRVRGCDFNVAVFTNLSPDHLDYHGTMDAYLHAKGLLFAQLGNTYNGKAAVLNADDPVVAALNSMTTADVITYGIKNKADVFADDIMMTSGGTSFVLHAFDETVNVNMKLIGKFSVYNTLAAITAALVSGVDLRDAVRSVEKVEGVDGRFETIDEGQPFTVLVDYAHTPDSLENVLKTVNDFAKNKITVIVGCGGDRDRTKRPVMAKIAVEHADQAIFTSDNPRSEDPYAIIEDMKEGVSEGSYIVELDRERAIHSAIKHASPNDIIIIAGKGHETYQILREKTIHFDDREVARRAIRERLKSC